MALTHLWYTCCIGDAGEDWDVAAVPEYNGTTTSNFNADTFRIWGDTEHPEEAFEVLTYLIGDASAELLQIYGGMPAIEADQDAFFAGLDETYPQGVDWQVVRDSVAFADNPSFEAFVPNYQEAFEAIVAFGDTLRSTEGLDVDAEIEAFRRSCRRSTIERSNRFSGPSASAAGGPLSLHGGYRWRSSRWSPMPSSRSRHASSLARREAIWGYLFISPWLIGFLFLTLAPMVATLRLHVHQHQPHPGRRRFASWASTTTRISSATRGPGTRWR